MDTKFLKTKKVYVTDKETKDLIESDRFIVEIEERIIKNNKNHIYLNMMQRAIKNKGKEPIFISINPENIELFKEIGFTTIFGNTGYNDIVEINPTYERRINNKQKTLHI